MEPISLGVGVLVGLAMAGCAALASRLRSPQVPVGTSGINIELTAMPDDFFSAIDRDMAVLDPDTRVEVTVEIEAPWGWEYETKDDRFFSVTSKRTLHYFGNDKALRFVDIHARAEDVADVLRSLMLDYDAGMVGRRTDRTPSPIESFPELEAHARRTGIYLRWLDEDSPLKFSVTGRVKMKAMWKAEEPVASESAAELCPDEALAREVAVAEVEERLQKHNAAMKAAHGTLR